MTRSQILEVVVPIMYSRPELLVTQREIRSCEAKRDWAKNIRMKNAGCYNHGANSKSDRYYGIVPIAYYRPGQPNWEYIMGKFQDLLATQILREINFGHFEAPKTAILTI